MTRNIGRRLTNNRICNNRETQVTTMAEGSGRERLRLGVKRGRLRYLMEKVTDNHLSFVDLIN